VRRSLSCLALVLLAAGVGVTASGADFTAASPSPGNSFAAAADFNTVAVTLTDPGATLHGTVSLAATATSERGIATVRYQTSPAGAGTWTDACVASSAPFSCSFDTTAVADGLRDVRAIATDQAGYAKTSAVVSSRRVDNTLPTVSLTDPGTLTGTEALNATAADAGSGLASLSIDYRPATGGSWTTVCSGATSPRACSLNSALLLDGSYELRAHATDAAGNVADSSLTRVVDNTAPTGSIPQPGPLRGTVDVAITAADGAGSGVASVTGQFRQAGTSTWSDVCTDAVAPYACTGLDTIPYPDGLYDARAIVVDGIGLSTTTATITVRIDNTAPSSATLTNPGTSLSGSVALSGTAADAGSGIAAWTVQYRAAGGSTWTDACSDTTSSYGCTWATTGVTDGLYDVRALARDNAGNTTGSTVYSSVRVDNVAPTVTLADPGTPITNTVTLSANAADDGGIASVVFERSRAGLNTWTTICTDTVAPYTCALDTTTLSEVAYDLRARVTDNAGRTATSVVASRTVNHAPYGTDVQATNGGSAAGKMETGDVVRLTYSEAMAPASILSGWTGSAQAIRVYVNDGGTIDTMDFRNSTGATRLNLVNSATDLSLAADFVSTATIFNATMSMSGTVVTVTLGSKVSGTLKTTATAAAKLTWRPSALATDLAGIAALTTLVNESGTSDRDF
jgi:chitinase